MLPELLGSLGRARIVALQAYKYYYHYCFVERLSPIMK